MMSYRGPLITLLFLTGLSSGCAMHREVRVDSMPAGADVYASSILLGTTPLVTDRNTLFPSREFGFDRTAQRMLVLRKDGYADAYVSLTEWSTPRALNVNLQPVPGPAGRSVELRLQELGRIHARGLMTDVEYREKKLAILSDL